MVSILFDAGQAAIVYNLLTSFGSSEIDNGQEICCPLSKKYVRRAADFIRILQAQANKEIDLSIFGSKEYKISIFSKDFFIMKIPFWGRRKKFTYFLSNLSCHATINYVRYFGTLDTGVVNVASLVW